MTVSLAPNEDSKDEDVRLFLRNPREDLPAGLYREQYTVRYWCGEPDTTMSSEVPGAISVNIQIPNVLSASVVGASTRGEIDFLDFSTLSRSLSIFVRSTGRYSVTARSLNGGAMTRVGQVSAAEIDRIGYHLRFDGQALADATGVLTRPRAGLAGLQIPLDVTVEDVSRKRAGRYSDTVMLTLSPVS